ncbi:MAG TPA: YjgN family protein [Ideonella sp.]|nr:YjgN family protein [Ideonella sp.]
MSASQDAGATNAPSFSPAAPSTVAPDAQAEVRADTQAGAAAAPADAAASGRHLRILFTGSGSEYFRIWIVNLLLSIVTLSLYLPFAKARRLAYFHGNTQIDGHALGFHGNPWKMLRGYLLMLGLGGTYTLATRFSPIAALAAVTVMSLAWPALWRASLQFRLANTSWRGLRFGFEGDLRGAYLALLPAFVPAVAMVAALAAAGPEAREPGEPAGAAGDPVLGLILGGAMLAALLLWPLAIASIKRYQHGHYRYSTQHSVLRAGTGAFYKLGAKAGGVGLLIALASTVLGVAVGFAMAKWGAGAASDESEGAGKLPMMIGMVVGIAVFYGALLLVLLPYWTSRLQNLVWGATASAQLRFCSRLRLRPLIGLHLKNALLTAVTLGLYWPFAAVATARMRLHAISMELDGDVDQWVADGNRRFDDASGDAAGDFFGIDLGL